MGGGSVHGKPKFTEGQLEVFTGQIMVEATAEECTMDLLLLCFAEECTMDLSLLGFTCALAQAQN